YAVRWRKANKRPATFLPLEFEPGQDAQVDWGEAQVILAGERQTVQVFVMHLCYSRRTFVMTFPASKQEAFFYGHVCGFSFFGGVPVRISYDNLSSAIKPLVQGRIREEQRAFIAFRSHYLFESHFCTPHQGHEKGGVEGSVGFSRRNYLVPMPRMASFQELNQQLLEHCLRDDVRVVDRQAVSIGEAFKREQPCLRPLPKRSFDCCVTRMVHLNGYSQVTYETNRYSVPVEEARRELILKAYPFHVEIHSKQGLLARHERCFGYKQDVFDPLHYLPLLEHRPYALEYAKPLRKWQKDWPESYHLLLRRLREAWPEGRGVKEFVQVLRLHQQYPAKAVEQAVEAALSYGCAHFDGVKHCLEHQGKPADPTPLLDLTDRPHLALVGSQPVNLHCYDQLLERSVQ
ncbi:MAG TPA: IS21 family transposase, partial [Ktedonobacteraceae bacterium]|nr:IS21 family transposase [Ktedonobacteraceae bacterium]